MITKPDQARWWVVGAAITLLAAALILWKSGTGPEVTAGRAASTTTAPAASGTAPRPQRDAPRDHKPRELRLSDLPPLSAPQRPPHPPGSEENEEWIATTIATLDTLAWEDDADSMRKILAEMRSPLPEIRAAALNATLDFDDPAAIPYLRAISNDTADLLEQKEIADLIETLELPSLIETLEQK